MSPRHKWRKRYFGWPAMKKLYEPLVAHVSHRADLTYVIGEMIGELNAGHAYVGGRSPRHAELAAVFDGLLQDPASRPGVEVRLVGPLEAAQRERRTARQARSAPTRVEFFTLVRGED